jgi:uracil-DNA glycosylase family 4
MVSPIKTVISYYFREAPGEDEETMAPFVESLVAYTLRDVGIDRTTCLMANVCQVRPPGNRIEAFAWTGPEITDGLAKLTDDIKRFDPHLCVLLGGTPLKAAREDRAKITEWRGSLFVCSLVTSPFYNRKCIGALHPLSESLVDLSRFDLRERDEKPPTYPASTRTHNQL